jgi:hypothetical protein
VPASQRTGGSLPAGYRWLAAVSITFSGQLFTFIDDDDCLLTGQLLFRLRQTLPGMIDGNSDYRRADSGTDDDTCLFTIHIAFTLNYRFFCMIDNHC